MRLAYYAGASTAAAAACLLKAFHERPNFYSATVYLSQSNACLLILTNLLLVLACTFMYALQRLLYGPLRPIEIEQLSEKAWYAVLDTLLAMPSFRDDVGGWLLAMFTLLLAGKIWGWIGEGKVDVLEQQPPANPRLFHARLATSLVISLLFDMWMLHYCVETVLADPRPGMMVIFTFEFAILTISSAFTFARYGLSVIQAKIEGLQLKKAIDDRKIEIRAQRAAARQNETSEGQAVPASPPIEEPIEVDENEVDVPGWEDKRRYLFFLEVFTDFVKLMIYIVFFTVSITFNGLPMHIMRDVYMTFASFSKRISDYMAYRKATSDMNSRYPDATTAEIRDDACIVCREGMVAWEQPNAQGGAQPAAQQPDAAPAPTRRRDEGLRAKKLPCGHILHLRCLKAWLERQQVCPTCRRPVVAPRDTAAPGQAGVPGQNPAAQGQQGRQQAQRQGRARVFNLGPVRIGFLNGPGDQIGNLVRQMQHPQAAGRQDGAQGANQQGPNHLGLPVPYLSGQDPPASTPTQSTQMQIMQLQQRIMQDARNLSLEHQQLGLLRSMDNELAALRAMQQPPHPPTSSNAATQRQQPAAPPQPAHMQMPASTPLQQSQSPYSMTALHGNTTERLASGDQNLPAGLTLPEGWTLMPLHRAGATNAATAATQPVNSHLSNADQLSGSVSQGTYTAETTQNGAQASLGPTDEQGSPLFVPTIPAANDTIATNSAGNTHTEPPSQNEHSGSETWSFDHIPNGHSTQSEQSGEASLSTNSEGEGQSEQVDQKYVGKGKAKAAEVEDAPDSGT